MKSPIKVIMFPGGNVSTQQQYASGSNIHDDDDDSSTAVIVPYQQTKQPQLKKHAKHTAKQQSLSLQQYMNLRLQQASINKMTLNRSYVAPASTIDTDKTSQHNLRSSTNNKRRNQRHRKQKQLPSEALLSFTDVTAKATVVTDSTTTALSITHPIYISPLFERVLKTIQCHDKRNVECYQHSNLQTKLANRAFVPEITTKTVKKVRFAIHPNVIIQNATVPTSSLFDVDTSNPVAAMSASLSTNKTLSLLWYSASEYAKFRTEANDMVSFAMGDVDYQQFFLNTLYPYCCNNTLLESCDKGSPTATELTASLSYSSEFKDENYIVAEVTSTTIPKKSPLVEVVSDSDSTCSSTTSTTITHPNTMGTDDDSCRSLYTSESTNTDTSNASGSRSSSTSSCTGSSMNDMIFNMMMEDDTDSFAGTAISTELEMISKYRGLERVIYRALLLESKLYYIQQCIKEHAEDCYYDEEGDNDDEQQLNNPVMDSNHFRHYLLISKRMAQFFGHFDYYSMQQDIYNDKKREYQEFLLLQQERINESLTSITNSKDVGDENSEEYHQRQFMEI